MSSAWLLTRFDYDRFVEIRPVIRAARSAEAFAQIASGAETVAIAEAVEDGSLSIPEAKSAFILAACSVGETLGFEKGLARLIREIARRPGGDGAAEMLNDLVAGGRNLEPWLESASGLMGFLKPDEVERLYAEYLRAVPSTRRGVRAMSRRRGGCLGAVFYFVGRLFVRAPAWEEMLLPLGRLITEAATRREGLAAVEL